MTKIDEDKKSLGDSKKISIPRAQICRKFGGFYERGVWYFPSPHQKDCCRKALIEAGYGDQIAW